MPWYTFSSKRPSPDDAAVPAALTAAASPPKGPEAQFVRHPDKWQNEVWNYYDTLGEFNYGVWWLSNMLSRVRLRAAKLQPDVDEPDVQDKGPAADLMMRLGGGVSGQAQIMKRLTVQLSLPGEGYLIGESVDGVERWQVRSVDEIRAQSGSYYVMDEESVSSGNQWRPVADDNHVVRVWRPHDRYYHLADSPSRSAREIMRELELVNRHISAQYLSRLASAGLLKIPDEITFPVREEFLDAPNPIMSEFIEIAAEAIKTPGTASAVIPIPISGPAEALKEMGLVDFTLKIDEKIIDKRDSAIKRLATKLDLPAEILLGMGDVNHWCKTDTTRILAKDRGWVRHTDLSVGDLVMTLDHTTGTSSWQPVKDIYRARVTEEPMLRMTSKTHTSLSTAGHRWPVVKTGKFRGSGRRWTTSEQGFAAGDRVPVAAPCTDLPVYPKYTDDFVSLIAAFTADGTVLRYRSGTPHIRIVKFDAGETTALRAVLTAVYGRPPTEHAHPTRTCIGTAFVLGADASAGLFAVTGEDKAIKSGFVDSLTRSQLLLLLDSMVRLGDGAMQGRDYMIHQVVPERLDAFERAAILLGLKVSRGVRNQQTGYGDRPLSWLRISRSRSVFAPWDCEQTWETYTGVIWCPVTDNGTWLAQSAEGSVYFTGNSAWALDEAALKTHIAPVAELICDSLTRGYLQPRLAASGEDPADWVVWYDMSELALRPDRSTNAGEAYDRMELSGQAYRRELGFDEDDRPEGDDLVEQGLKIIVRTVPNAAPAALDKLTGQDVLDPNLLKPAAPKPTGPQGVVPPQGNENAPPGTQEKPPPAQGQAASARLQQSIQQARTQHAIRFGTGSRWELLHPEVCAGQVFGCPFTHAVSTAAPISRPGTSGTYLCHLDAFGLLAIDGQSPYMDTTKMLTTSLVPRSNGHARI